MRSSSQQAPLLRGPDESKNPKKYGKMAARYTRLEKEHKRGRDVENLLKNTRLKLLQLGRNSPVSLRSFNSNQIVDNSATTIEPNQQSFSHTHSGYDHGDFKNEYAASYKGKEKQSTPPLRGGVSDDVRRKQLVPSHIRDEVLSLERTRIIADETALRVDALLDAQPKMSRRARQLEEELEWYERNLDIMFSERGRARKRASLSR